MADKLAGFDFSALVGAIRQAHEYMAAQAGRAINISLTLRNWVIGCYIREYEQNGTDRAQYGERLLDLLAERLQKSGLKRVESRELRRYRQFYQLYPQIRESVTPELNRRMNETLEAMARAIFKSWFIDFDPVRANAEGRHPGLPDEISALFPDSFEDSELGEIPSSCAFRIRRNSLRR
jgi:hypothetical protein